MAKLSFANLSVRFGEKELLDYKEIISRAFTHDTLVRKYGRTRYHFFETELVWLDKNDPLSLVIAGRFIKDTVLAREQVLEGSELVQDRQTLRSSPSALFVFFLADHRLAFLPETPHAPTLGNFASTIEHFIKREFKEFIDEFYKSAKRVNPKFTRNMAFQEHSPPSISLVPLTSRDSIEKFLDRFASISNLTIHVIARNQDMDGSNLFERLYNRTEKLEPTSAKLVVNAGKDGLKIEETKNLVEDATKGGYEKANVKGTDHSGAELAGSNDDFRLRVEVDSEDLSADDLFRKLVEEYNQQKSVGNIKVSPRDPIKIGPLLQDLKSPDD